MRKGPNNASRVVWALGECFFFYIRVFSYILMIYTGTIYIIQARMMITGPNDAYCVVWAQGKYFLIYSCFSRYTYYVHLLCSIDSLIDFKTKGPKRCDMTPTRHQHDTTLTSPTTYHPNLDGLPRHHTT